MTNTEFLTQVQASLTASGIASDSYRNQLEETIHEDEISDFYLTRGFAPDNPAVVFDCMAIGREVVYGFYVNKDKTSVVATYPLHAMTRIWEALRQDTLKIEFGFGSSGYFLIDELTDNGIIS